MNRSPGTHPGALAGAILLLVALGACGSRAPGSAPVPPTPPPAAFSAQLDAGGVSVSQGSRAGVWVNVTRAATFTDAVTVALDSPPEGVLPSTLTIAALSTAGLFEVEVAPDFAVGGTVQLALVATGGGTTVRLAVTATVTAAVPTAESLIATDLAAGTIDYPTSLLYRAYALFHDPRLPPQYAGSSSPHNDGFFIEASKANLPADVQAQLQPYLARPTDPASWFQQSSTAQAAALARAAVRSGATPAAADPPPSPCTLADGEIEYQHWKSTSRPIAGGGALRFWAPCSPDGPGLDSVTLEYMDAFAGPVADQEAALMGPPVSDYGGVFYGSDPAIDIYLVTSCAQEQPQRADGTTLCSTKEKSGSIAGVEIDTRNADGVTGNQCSAFIIIDRSEIDGGSFKSTFAHEFFHVLQDAHACQLGESEGTGEYWYREASATWAEASFVPETAVTEVHKRFVNDFQKSTESLHKSGGADPDHIYAAYIWPFFFEQKKNGGRGSVAIAWNALSQVASLDAANQALDGVYKFKSNFRDFAVTNLNFALPNALMDSDRYQASPQFPAGKPDILKTTFSTADKTTEALNLDALRAVYSEYAVTGTTVKKLVFTFNQIQVRDGLDIDAILQINGQPWVRRAYDDADTVRFCLDKPDQNLTDSYWVLSNHNVPFDQMVEGLVKVEASEVACGKSWSGVANSDFGDTMHATVTWVFDDQHSTDTVAVFYPTGTVSFTAPGCTVNPGSSAIGQGDGSLRIDYSTIPPTYQVGGASVWAATWQCGSGNPFQSSAGGFWLSDFNKVPSYATGTVPAVDKNGNIVLTGTDNSPGYTFGWKFTED